MTDAPDHPRRPRSRRRTALAGAALTAALGAGTAGLLVAPAAGAGAADGDGVLVRPLTVDVTVGPLDDQHCSVTADLYTPSWASPTRRVPAILTTNGFGGSKADQAGIGQAFARRGYAVLSYSGLGFGGSGCKITLDDPQYDGKAAQQLVDVLAGTRAAADGTTVDVVRLDGPGDPRVGMIGGSYGGEIQFAAASLDRRIDALVPLITWNDLAYSLAPQNQVPAGSTAAAPVGVGVHKRFWTSLFFGIGIVDGVQGVQVDPSRDVGCPNFTDQACQAKAQLEALGYPDDATLRLTRETSVASYLDRVHAPTFLIQGQADTLFDLQEAARTYTALKAQGTPVSMAWQYWGHSEMTPAPGELDLSGNDLSGTYLGQRISDWFDHWLKGVRSAPTGPGFAYFRDWVPYTGNAAPAYGTASSYPVSAGQPLYLSGNGDLVTARTAVRPGSATWSVAPALPTSYSEVSGVEGSYVPAQQPYDAPGTFAAWTSGPLDHDVDVVGVPTLDVKLSAPVAAAAQAAGPAGRLVLMAKLYDVAPDGTEHLQHKLISPVRVTDVTEPLRIELPGIVERFPAGHRIRLVLAASDAAYNPSDLVGTVTVAQDPAAPNLLRLPVVGPGVG